MFLKSMQVYCIYLSFCLTTQLYWVPTVQNFAIIELRNSIMELHNSNYGVP